MIIPLLCSVYFCGVKIFLQGLSLLIDIKVTHVVLLDLGDVHVQDNGCIQRTVLLYFYISVQTFQYQDYGPNPRLTSAWSNRRGMAPLIVSRNCHLSSLSAVSSLAFSYYCIFIFLIQTFLYQDYGPNPDWPVHDQVEEIWLSSLLT